MRTATLFPPELLEPIPGDAPGGVNLRFAPEWKALEEAKREDDGLEKGDWAAMDQKLADWDAVGDRANELLLRKTKDLRLAMFLLEAAIRKEGFSALSDGLKFLQDFVAKFWDAGLHPEPDGDSFDDRAAAFDWINEKLPDLLRAQAITERSGAMQSFTFSQYIDARAVGRERDYEEGKAPREKRERFLKARQEGRCLDVYDVSVASSHRAHYEELGRQIASGLTELKALGRLLNEKFGSPEAAPGLAAVRDAMEEICAHLDTILASKRREEPDAVPGAGGNSSAKPGSFTNGFPLAPGLPGTANAGDWAAADELVRAGQVEKGLAEMTLLAQRETSGRARFQRKLLLAEVAMQLKKDHLAQSILEELAEQIDAFKLVEWETTDVVGAVWTRLYRLHKRAGNTDRAQQLYQRLCRVDPWQALACTED